MYVGHLIYEPFFSSYEASEDDELGPDGKKLRAGISSKIIEELTDCNAALSQQRKRRQVLQPYMKIKVNFSYRWSKQAIVSLQEFSFPIYLIDHN